MKYFFYLFDVLLETFLISTQFFVALLSYPFPIKNQSFSLTKEKEVILVQRGWFSDNLYKRYMKRCLENMGYQVYFTNFGLHLGDIDKITRCLKKFVDESGLTDFTLLGTSLGGLISLNYLQNYDGWKKVNRLITLGSPLRGTNRGPLGFFSKSARQFTPGSDFMKSLHSKRIKNKKRIYNFHAKYDELVPKKFSILPYAHKVEVDLIGHSRLIHSIKTYHKIQKVISESL